MQKPMLRAPICSARIQLPPVSEFPKFEIAKESILKLSSAFEQRGSGGKSTEKRKPFEEVLKVATEGMLSSVRKTMPS